MKIKVSTTVSNVNPDAGVGNRVGELLKALAVKADGSFTSFEDFLSLPGS